MSMPEEAGSCTVVTCPAHTAVTLAASSIRRRIGFMAASLTRTRQIASYISGGKDMRALPWIIAGVGIGVGVTMLLFNEGEPSYATDTAYDSVERAARKTFGWGTKKRAEGKVGAFAGAVKEGVGRLTGDYD